MTKTQVKILDKLSSLIPLYELLAEQIETEGMPKEKQIEVVESITLLLSYLKEELTAMWTEQEEK